MKYRHIIRFNSVMVNDMVSYTVMTISKRGTKNNSNAKIYETYERRDLEHTFKDLKNTRICRGQKVMVECWYKDKIDKIVECLKKEYGENTEIYYI